MTFSQAISYLNNLKPIGIQMGLERMINTAKALGNPERSYPSVHIAGTNGKGSTAHMLACMLNANGYRTGLYTSPMVTEITDMILIDGQPVSKERFASCVAQVANAAEQGLSEYECLTMAVFLCFQQEQVDIAIIECCLGGETDATNIIPAPLCAVFTPIDIDHAAILGNTIEEITTCKSGIIKASCDVICTASMSPEALGVIFEKASSLGSTVYIPAHNTTATVNTNGTHFLYEDKTVSLSLVGKHQYENALTALETIKCLQHRGFRLDIDTCLSSLQHVIMACRLEIVSHDPFILLDGAHNPHGISALCESLDDLAVSKGTLVIGMLADKDISSCLQLLSPYFDRIICCKPPNTPRALPAVELAKVASRFHGNVQVIEDPIEAFENAKRSSEHKPVVVGGSFYTASIIRHTLKNSL